MDAEWTELVSAFSGFLICRVLSSVLKNITGVRRAGEDHRFTVTYTMENSRYRSLSCHLPG